jgi:hypothetical protein
MPSHFSSIGLDAGPEYDDFVHLAETAAEQADTIPAGDGHYLRWTGSSGEELWLQIDSQDRVIGFNPHFTGKSSIRLGLSGSFRREGDSPLDATFQAWADPQQDNPDSGAYPLVFDVPDAATYPDLDLPRLVVAQIAAFAHEIKVYESPEAFGSEPDQSVASQAFVPIGLLSEDDADLPESMAMITGHVTESSAIENEITGQRFYSALIESYAGNYDVVIDRTLISERPPVGGVISGVFWLSGRLTSMTGAA